MNRLDFIMLLNEKLYVLSEDDKKDAISYYLEIIDDKIDNGISEEAAVSSLGNIDDLIKIILDDDYNSNKESQKETILAYKLILEELSSALNNENISSEERIKITDKMIEVADKISAKDTENKQFLDNMIKYGGSLAAGALILGAVILGVNVNGVELPKLKK